MRRPWHAAGNQICRAAAVCGRFVVGLLFLFTLVVSCNGRWQNADLHDASMTAVGENRAELVPRVPSHDANVTLYGQVTNLAFGSTVTVVANHVSLPPMAHDGVFKLLTDVPIGTLYDVSLPNNPRGQVCSVTPLHGAVGPHTPYVKIMCQLSVVTANDVNDTVVLGQIDDATVIAQTPPDETTLLAPWGKVVANVDSTLFVADRGNHRVLAYYPAPVSGAWATMVLGQNNDFLGDSPNGGTLGFDGPSSVGGGNGLLLVADTNNNRVLVYTPMPYGQVDPTWVLGQSNLATTSAACGPAGLTAPNQAATSGNMVLVADTGNHRVLIWNRWPTMLGAPADLVLGQPDLASCLPNQGTGLPQASSLSSPADVWTDQNRIAVADTANHRVLIWLDVPVLTGQAADLAVGQPDLLSGASQTTSSASINGPASVVFDNNTLFVADSVDHRVLAFNPFPTASGAHASYALGQHLATDNLCNQGNLVAAYTMCMPTGVSFVAGDLAVTDSNNNRVLIFYSDPNAVGLGSFSVVVSPGSSFFTARLSPVVDATAGEAANASVTALTFEGSFNPNYLGTITFTSTDPNAILPANYTYTPADAGVHDFNVTFFRATTHTLSVHDVSNAGARGADPNILVVAGDANYVAVTNFPSNPNAGQQAGLLVTAYDTWNNVATTFAGTVTFTSSDPNALLPAPYTFVPSDAGVHAFAATLVTPGNQNITVNANGLTVHAGTQQNIIVASPPRPLGGAVSGLVTGNVTLVNTVNGDTVIVGNGNYLFDQNVLYTQNYNVVALPPSGQLCAVANGNGIMGLNGEFNVFVTCMPHAYILGGKVTGLVAGAQVNVQNSPDAIAAANGNFVFPTGVAYDSNFNASLTNPNGQTCVFVGNSNAGIMPASNDMNIAITCTPNPYSLGGAISGLLTNTNVTLSDGNDIISRTNGSYTFPTLLPYTRAYSIGIVNPNGQTCAFNPNSVGNGNMPAAPVTNANVVCTTNAYPLGGRVSGLVTGNITLTNTVNADVISVGNGNYVFDQNIAYAGNYNVTMTSPNGLACAVANGNAVMAVGGEFNVYVACTPKVYTLGGNISGLLSNTNVTLSDGNDTIATSNGNFIFPTQLAYNSNFSVSLTNPNGQTCAFTSNSNVGTMPPYNDLNVLVTCTTNAYTLGGAISGLLTNTNVTLSDGNDTISRTNGSYVFPTSLPYARHYSIGIVNPNGQTCAFNPNAVGNGNMPAASVTNANVLCTTNTYPLGGTVSGLISGNVTLTNTVNADAISVGNGNYLFDQNVAYAGNYNVVAASPTGMACTVANGNAVMAVGGNFNVVVTCVATSHTLGGNISGLITNTNVTLKNSNDTIATTNGNFTFPTAVATNSNFNVSLVNPNGQTCTFTSNSNAGVMPGVNDMNVLVTCTTNTYSLGGAISGLLTNTNVTLADGNDTISRTNGGYTFPTLLPYGRVYSVGITNPTGQTCAFNPNSAGYGTMATAPVTNANVVCTTNTYVLGGSVTGLLTGNVTLTNTINSDVIQVGNGNYVFDQNVVYAGNYNVVATSPNGQTCAVANGNAVMPAGGNFNVVVTCSATSATYLVLSNYNTPRTAGQNSNIQITAYDAFNHVAIGYTGTVHLASTDANAIFSPNFTFVPAFAGSANVPITMTTAGTQAVTGNDTVAPTIAGRQGSILVNPNVAASLGLSNYTTPRVAGTNSNVTLTAYDAYHNVATAYTGTVHLTVTDTNAVFSPNFTFVSGYAGGANVPITMTTAGVWAITGNDTATPTLAGTLSNITVTAANANRYVLSGYPNPDAACTQANINVKVLDIYGNTATGYTGTIALSSNDANATFSPNYTFSAGDAGLKALAITLHTTGTWRIQGNDTTTPAIAGSQTGIVVNPNHATRLALTNFPNPVVAGTPGNVTITAYDACGNVDVNYTGTIYFSSTDGNATLSPNYTFSLANAGVATRPVTLQTSRGQNINANDITTPSIAGQQNILVNPNSTKRYALTGYPSQVNIATQANVYIIALDQYANVAYNYTGTAAIHSTDGNATLPANRAFTAADAGVVGVPVRLNAWGTWAISANDTITSSIAGNEGNILVAFTPMPVTPSGSSGLTGWVWHNTPTTADPPQYADLVNIYKFAQTTTPNDIYVDSYINSTRHLSFNGGSSTASYLGSDASGSAAADTLGFGYTAFMFTGYLVVPSGGNYTISSANADDGMIAYLGGGPQGGNTTLVMLINYNNSVTHAPGYSNPATLPLNQAGAYPLMVLQNNWYGGITLDFNVYGPAQATFLTGPPPWLGAAASFSLSMSPNPIVAGVQGSLTITPLDANGIPVTGYGGTVSLVSSDASSLYTTPVSFASQTTGGLVVPIRFRTAGTMSLTANDVVQPSLAGQSNVVVTCDGSAVNLACTYSNVTAGSAGSLAITALDANGNTATSYTGTVKVTSNDGNAILPANRTFVTADHGVASVSVTLKAIATNATVTATDMNASYITCTAANVLVYPAPNGSTPGGTAGLTGQFLHRGTDTSLAVPAQLSDLATAINYLYTHTLSYTFTNTHINTSLAISYSGTDSSTVSAFLGSDATGSAASDSNAIQTSYLDYAGYMKVTSGGNFTFTMGTADDGALLFMGGGTAPGATTLVMASNWLVSNIVSNFASPLTLHLPAAGYYPIELFFENTYCCASGGINLHFSVSGPGTISFVTGSTIGFLSDATLATRDSAFSEIVSTSIAPVVPDVWLSDPETVGGINDPLGAPAPPSSSVFAYLPDIANEHAIALWSNGSAHRASIPSVAALGLAMQGPTVLSAEAQDPSEGQGVWLLNAIRKDDGRLIGLYRRTGSDPNQPRDFHTSAIAWSDDDGHTWTKQGLAVGRPRASAGSDLEPEMMCMIYDSARARWLGIGHGRGYASSDPNAAPGTWYGWHEGSFEQPEPDTTARHVAEPLPGLSEDMQECKLHFNAYLELFVLVWRPSGNHVIMQSYSYDGVSWSAPTPLVRGDDQRRLSHAQIVGTSDVLHGRRARLIYQQHVVGRPQESSLVSRAIVFDRPRD